MIYELKNEEITVKISDHGAELKSITRNYDGREYLWQADPAYWGRTSPVLFPVVGCYYGKESRYKGKTYSMGQHGFARDMDFELVEETSDSIEFKLVDAPETHEKYPFAFELRCGYKLTGKEIQVIWKVTNTDSETSFFSIGAHPAFLCDMDNDVLKLEKEGEAPSAIRTNVVAQDGSGCLSDRTKEFSLIGGILGMSDELFAEDALVIEHKQIDTISIVDGRGNAFVKVSFDTPLVGVWSPVGKHAPFVCIEPWYGRCDRVGFSGDISEREYGNKLDPGEEFKASYYIEIK
ncbi:aldose 1-epimerase family protein [Butyrivibrio sp. CB08]|uniref:aldose 1-epimerase family protein n=1 Tax=Butyrivibrio sp. CB08 TaxID=2364879 RepID=UPI000EA870DD|nr:aldose 1-epimerase family protein [Butyrivibrio sp. CB08]RKM59289.1 aldose 1-epimerase family protein [Butyrivibrio sp. CB08]